MKIKAKIYTVILLAFLATHFTTLAQEIKFPESFKADTSLFRGMKIAEIPSQVKTNYGISENPGLIIDASKTKGILMSGKIPNVKAVYFEIYEDTLEEKMDCGFEVAQFASETELNKVLVGLDKKNRGVAFLTLKNYLIIVYCDGYKNFAERIDDMTKYFRQKLGAKLFQDRRKDVGTSVSDGYVTNLPPPLPPEPKGNYTSVAMDDLDKRIANVDGFAYMRNKKREKLAPGKYRASSIYPAFESLVFTINQDSLLNGDYEYHYAEDYSKSPSKESKLVFNNGVAVSEIVYQKGKLMRSKTFSASVVKEKKDYLITLITSIKNPATGDQDIKTIFRNRKPIAKITARAGVSVVRKDFEKNYLDVFNNKGQLIKLQKPGLTEEYNDKGEVTYKKEWSDGYQFIYRNGVLRYKEVKVKNKDQFLVTEYDESGKISKAWKKGIENSFAIANPDEYEEDLSEALFEYYKKLTQ